MEKEYIESSDEYGKQWEKDLEASMEKGEVVPTHIEGQYADEVLKTFEADGEDDEFYISFDEWLEEDN